MLHRVLKLYIIFGFCVVCIRSISITSLERLICENDRYNKIRSCIGTFILPNVVLTTSNCAEKCISVGKLPILRSFIHPHYKNYVHGKSIMARNDIAIVVTQPDKKRRKFMKLSALDNLSTIGLKALVPIMDDDKPRLAVSMVERCYVEQPFGYYICASNKVTKQAIKVCRERQEQGVPLLIGDRIFGIMGITDKDRCKLPQRTFTALGPALYWISDTVRNIGYDEAVITTLHDKTSPQYPHSAKTLLSTAANPPTQTLRPAPIITKTTLATHSTKITPPPTTIPPIATTTRPIPTTTLPTPTTSPIPTLEEHYNTYPAETPLTVSTRIYTTTSYSPKTLPVHLHLYDPGPEDHHSHPTYLSPSSDYPEQTDYPSTFHSTAGSYLSDSPPKFFKRYTAIDNPPTFPKGFTIDPSLIMNLRQNKPNPYLDQIAQKPGLAFNHSYVSGTIPKGPYSSISNAFNTKVLRLSPKDVKDKRQDERKKNAIDYFLKAHKSLKTFNIANAKNDFIIPDNSPVVLPLTLNKAAPIMRTQKVSSTEKSHTKKQIKAITFVPLTTPSRSRATTLSKSSAPKKTTKLTTKSTTVTIPFFKVLENDKKTNIMDWFNVMVKDKLKNQTSVVFYVATTTTTEAYSPLSSHRPLNFIDLT